MKGKYCLLNFVLLISIIGVMVVTASEYIDCKDIYPDEFFDLALTWQYSILPVFVPHLNNHPYLLHSSNSFYLERIDLLTPVLRC
jgi:hypothetical protein